MKQEYLKRDWKDDNGNPDGGVYTGKGFMIGWQKGPLVVDGIRVEPNGAFVETIIDAVVSRIEFYQDSKFACLENEAAIYHLKAALAWLDARTKSREARGVEGTHQE